MRIKGPYNVETDTCPCRCWNRDQHEWFALVDRVGEAAARVELARRLRQAADQVEKGGYPDVFGCILPAAGPDRLTDADGWMGTISVTLSYPWPG